jgi:hypothetical protein
MRSRRWRSLGLVELATRPFLRLLGRWRQLALVVVSITVALVGLELALRAMGVQPQTATVLKSFFQRDPNTGWIGRPNVACRFRTANFDVTVTHDAEGFRTCDAGRPDAHHRAPPTEVVWCVGDSGTWGWGVPDGKTYVDVLNRQSNDGTVYRNLGVPGFSSVQEYLLLKQKFERGQKPTQVVILFCENDLEDNLNPHNHPPRPYLALAAGRAELKNWPVPGSFGWEATAWLKNHSRAYNYIDFCFASIKKSWRDRALRQEDDQEEARAKVKLNRREEQCLGLKAAYGRIKQLCDANQVRLAVATEYGAAEYGRLGKFHKDLVDQVCGELSIPLLDLSAPWNQHFASAQQPAPLHFKTDPHYSVTGHRLLAQGISGDLPRATMARATGDAVRR